MSFCTKDQVKSMFRNFINATTPAVTDASIDEFIAESDEEINAALTGVYELPIVGVKSLLVLRKISRLLTAAVVDDILNTYAEADKKPSYRKDALYMLGEITGEIKNGKRVPPTALLPDAVYIGSNINKNTVAANPTDGRQFEKGVDSW